MILRITAAAATLVLAASTLAFAADETYQLKPQNDSGETGTITLAPTSDGKGTVVTIVTKGGGDAAQPVHVHVGPCAKLDPKPTYPLKTIQDGKSTTTLAEVPMSKLTDGHWAINVHKSTSDIQTYVSCADLTPPKASSSTSGSSSGSKM